MAFVDELKGLGPELGKLEKTADKGKSPVEIDCAKYVRTQKQLNTAARAEAKTRRKMLRAVAAGPTPIPDPGEAAVPDSEQQS